MTEEKMFYFVRSVPLLVGVKAETESEAWKIAGHRVDDFMTDAVESVERISHEDESTYVLDYHGDAIYPRLIDELHEVKKTSSQDPT